MFTHLTHQRSSETRGEAVISNFEVITGESFLTLASSRHSRLLKTQSFVQKQNYQLEELGFIGTSFPHYNHRIFVSMYSVTATAVTLTGPLEFSGLRSSVIYNVAWKGISQFPLDNCGSLM